MHAYVSECRGEERTGKEGKRAHLQEAARIVRAGEEVREHAIRLEVGHGSEAADVDAVESQEGGGRRGGAALRAVA